MLRPSFTRALALGALTLTAAPVGAAAQTVDRSYSGTCTAAAIGEPGSARTAPATFRAQVAAPDVVAPREEFSLSNLRVQTTTTALRQVLDGRGITALEGGARAFAAVEGGQPYSSGNLSESGVRPVSDATLDQLITLPGAGGGAYPVHPFWRWTGPDGAGDTRIEFRGVTAVYEARPVVADAPRIAFTVDCQIPAEAAQVLVVVPTRTNLPRLTSIAPAQGLALIPSVVTINGQNLRGVRRIAFGRAGTSSAFIVESPTRIRVLTPPLPPGRWPVSVQIAGYDSVGTTPMPAYLEIVPWP